MLPRHRLPAASGASPPPAAAATAGDDSAPLGESCASDGAPAPTITTTASSAAPPRHRATARAQRLCRPHIASSYPRVRRSPQRNVRLLGARRTRGYNGAMWAGVRGIDVRVMRAPGRWLKHAALAGRADPAV